MLLATLAHRVGICDGAPSTAHSTNVCNGSIYIPQHYILYGIYVAVILAIHVSIAYYMIFVVVLAIHLSIAYMLYMSVVF